MGVLGSIFSYVDEIEKFYHQVMEARNSLGAAFKAQGINEKIFKENPKEG
jgi:hypothetical protein